MHVLASFVVFVASNSCTSWQPWLCTHQLPSGLSVCGSWDNCLVSNLLFQKKNFFFKFLFILILLFLLLLSWAPPPAISAGSIARGGGNKEGSETAAILLYRPHALHWRFSGVDCCWLLLYAHCLRSHWPQHVVNISMQQAAVAGWQAGRQVFLQQQAVAVIIAACSPQPDKRRKKKRKIKQIVWWSTMQKDRTWHGQCFQ